jgi:hypothetical protein
MVRAVFAPLRNSRTVSRARISERTRARSVTSSTGLVRKSSAPASSPAILEARSRERGDQQDGNVGGLGIGLDPPTDLEPGHVRHQHVEDDQIGAVFPGGAKAAAPLSACSTE